MLDHDPAIQRLIDVAAQLPNSIEREEYLAAVNAALQGDTAPLQDLCRWKWKPVPIETFVKDPYFLGLSDDVNGNPQVFPKVLEILHEIVTGDYTEVVLTGGIGWGKSYTADLLFAYELYRVSCLLNPQKEYGLAEESSIVFIMQSISKEHAQNVLFGNIARLIAKSPYFREACPLDPRRTELLLGRGSIVMRPISGLDTAAIGLNVMFAIMDEANFMPVVTRSKRRPYGGPYGGEVHDVAVANYESLSRRMKSRFMQFGRLPGKLIMVSSKRYPDDFTERKIAEAHADIVQTGVSMIYVADLPQWGTKEDRLLGPRFRVVVGHGTSPSRVLKDEDPVPDHVGITDVVEVPVEYRKDFERDTDQALREIAGRSTLSLRPYIARRNAIEHCFQDDRSHPFSLEVTTLRDGLRVFPQFFDHMVKSPRAVHLDFGLGRPDATGFAMGYTAGVVEIERTAVDVAIADAERRPIEVREIDDRRIYVERLPVFVIEAMLRIISPPGDEVILADVGELVIRLRDEIMIPIQWVSADSFQSVATLQNLRLRGFKTGIVSVEKDTAYGDLKQAIYDRRLKTYRYVPWMQEIVALERDEKTGKIDHPEWTVDANGRRIPGTKDVADATAGVIHVLAHRSETWTNATHADTPIQRRSAMRVSVIRRSIPR